MGFAKEKPRFDPQTDYEDDFHAWCFEQAELLRQKRYTELDLPNIIEELESMGRSERHALTSSYRLLVAHLLKWQFQPEQRSRPWELTIVRERDNIEEREKRNPGLKGDAGTIATAVYGKARKEALIETGLPLSSFPAENPFTLEQLRDHDWLPE